MGKGTTLTLMDGVSISIINHLGLDQCPILVIYIVIHKQELIYGIDFLQTFQSFHLVFRLSVFSPLMNLLICKSYHNFSVVFIVLYINAYNEFYDKILATNAR